MLRFVVDRIKTGHVMKELVQIWVSVRIVRYFKQWQKEVSEKLLEIIDVFICLKYIVETRYLYET